MPKIITLTFNPCIDKSTTVPSLEPEKKLRCTPPKFEPGGGGINVARAIKKLGGEALAIYPSGGYSGKFLDELLTNEGVNSISIKTKEHTRENLIVLDESTNKQYRFGMPGPLLSTFEWDQCLDVLAMQDAEFIVVSGSLPGGVPSVIMKTVAWLANQKKMKLIVDMPGAILKHALNEGVYLIKPNLNELQELTGKTASIEMIEQLSRNMVENGQSRMVVVSMGADGATLTSDEGFNRYRAPKVKKLSTVGSGDSMVAGIVLKLSQGWPPTEAVAYGIACGTAATMNPGTELCHKVDVEELYSTIRNVSSNELQR